MIFSTVQIPNLPAYSSIKEEVKLIKTHTDAINYMHFCFNRMDTSANKVRRAYENTACAMYEAFTNKPYKTDSTWI